MSRDEALVQAQPVSRFNDLTCLIQDPHLRAEVEQALDRSHVYSTAALYDAVGDMSRSEIVKFLEKDLKFSDAMRVHALASALLCSRSGNFFTILLHATV
jgi:hypothetical protein